jgi:hypothetical protein
LSQLNPLRYRQEQPEHIQHRRLWRQRPQPAGHLAEVTDHRSARGIRHSLEAILAVIAVAKLCGADSQGATGVSGGPGLGRIVPATAPAKASPAAMS